MKKKGKGTAHPEARGLLLLTLVCLLLLSLMSYDSSYQSKNWLGFVGHILAWLFNYCFGLSTYLILAFLSWIGWSLLVQGKTSHGTIRGFYFGCFVVSCSILLNLAAEKGLPIPGALKHKIFIESVLLDLPYPHRHIRFNLGGVPFYYLYRDLPLFNLQKMLSDVGVAITFSITLFVSFLLLTETQLTSLFRLPSFDFFRKKGEREIEPPPRLPSRTFSPEESFETREIRIRTHTERDKMGKGKAASPTAPRNFGNYQLPPSSLLTPAKHVDTPSLKKVLYRQAEVLEETLRSFGIEAKVGDINSGPTITSFELHPATGVKVQKITALENDIALNLETPSIRIFAPLPGKAAIGVEIPSPYPQEVGFKEMLTYYQGSSHKFQIPLLLGKTVTGENVIHDLTKMPHCLIAGATGSGKSVCINTIIMSILMNARPDQVRLVMVDPKKVELTPYTSLPHMIAPVVTEARGAYAALNWLVREMQNRYDILKQLGLRNITAFNQRVRNQEAESSLPIAVPEQMSLIVAIIDEFADLMMTSSSDIETPVARIAQMARAVGIHLILATQRPSREVITGLIKANFPTRIAFKVASRINSQIILDGTGAESLLGNGDMLFLPPGSSFLTRAQGVYVRDEEIERVISFIQEQASPNYLFSSFDTMAPEESEGLGGESSRDSLYEQARTVVVETKNASTTFLQRKLKIGYARAASLMDELEVNGVISPPDGSRPRRVLKGDIYGGESGA